MAEALQVLGLEVTRGHRAVLHDVSFRADHGAITVILGPNASGKTTLLKAVVGLLPRRGVITMGGVALEDMDRRERARRMAYVPQHSALNAALSVDRVVAHGRYAHTRSATLGAQDKRAIADAMDATDVAALSRRSYLELSGGEQRRVLLARALATGARTLLLDEPCASLDIGHALALYALLRRLADNGRCVLMAMHDLGDALRWSDRAVLLHRNTCIASGPTPEIVSADNVARVYEVEMVVERRPSFNLVTS